MNWKTMLAYISGSVDEELLKRNAYLIEENRVLRGRLPGKLRFTDPERIKLAKLGKAAWHRKLVAKKFDGSQNRDPGRPCIDSEVEQLIVRMAEENPSWGYDRIVGALTNLDYEVSDQTVGNVLKRHGLEPAPTRKKDTTWLSLSAGTQSFS